MFKIESEMEAEMQGDPDKRHLKKQERHTQILLELRLAPHVRVSDLATTFNVTTETVRRDIAELSDQGFLQKSHGGASPCAPGTHRDLDERRRKHQEERRRLGRAAAGLVREGQTLMIDAGATTMEFARAIAFSGVEVTAITNSLQVAMILGTSASASVIMTPGHYLNEEAALTGTETCSFLHRYQVDACYLGASAIGERGISESIAGFSAVKRTMMEQSTDRFFLIDASKFGKRHLSKVADIGEIGSLVTDVEPADRLGHALREQGIQIIVT